MGFNPVLPYDNKGNSPPQILAKIAEEAGELISTEGRSSLTQKPINGPLKISADLLARQFIANKLKDVWPNLAQISEEGRQLYIPNPPYLLTDELDGSAHFENGGDQWGTMITLMDRTGPWAAAISYPDLGATISAQYRRGISANPNSSPMLISDRADNLRIGIENSTPYTRAKHKNISVLARNIGEVITVPCIASAAYKLVGSDLDIYINLKGAHIWDVAPLALLVSESNGVVTGPDGYRLRWDNLRCGAVAARNKAHHSAAMELVKTALRNE